MAVSISLSVTQNSQSTANNTSNITVKVNYSWTYGSYNRDSSTKYVKINGTKYSFNDADINPNATTSGSGTLYTKTLNISHNADGTKSVEVYAYVDTDISSGVLTKSTTKTLTTIPRASTVAATSAYVENESTITISRKSSSFTHTLTYSCGDASGTIATKTSSTSVKWKLPTSLYAQIGSTATSKTVTITCKTYKGDDLIGTKTCTLSAKTSASRNGPTLSPTVTADATTQGLTGNTTTLIKYISTANITFGAAARNSATLKSKKVTNSGKSRTTDGAFTAVTSGDFTFTATDSRGYSTSKTISVDLVPYVKLTCALKASMTVDGTMTIKASGSYYDGEFGAATNTLTVEYRYKDSDGAYGAWTSFEPITVSGNTYSATKTISGLDYAKTYVVEVRATDKIATVTPSAKNVKALPVFDWGENDFNFNVPVSVTDGDKIYNFSAIGKALMENTPLPCTVTPGTNYSSATGSVYMIGNQLRIHFNATRSSQISAGNNDNETICSFTVDTGGKVVSCYTVYGICANNNSCFYLSSASVDGDTLTFNIALSSVGIASSAFTSYFAAPVRIDLSKF